MYVEHEGRLAMQCLGVAENGQLPFGTICSMILEDVVAPIAIKGFPTSSCGTMIPMKLLDNARDFEEHCPGIVTCRITTLAGLDTLFNILASAGEDVELRMTLLPPPVMFGSKSLSSRIEFEGGLVQEHLAKEHLAKEPNNRMVWECDKFVVPYNDVRGTVLPEQYQEIVSRTCFPKIYESMVTETRPLRWDLAALRGPNVDRPLHILRYMVDWKLVGECGQGVLDNVSFDIWLHKGAVEAPRDNVRILGDVVFSHAIEWVVVGETK